MKTTSSSRRRRGRVMLCFGTAVILFAAAPSPAAFADPMEQSVPDDGARPDGDPGNVGTDGLPSGGDSPVSGPGVSRGPYANRIAEQARALAQLGEATTAASEDLDDRVAQTEAAKTQWTDLSAEANELADLAADMVTQHYENAAGEVQGVTDQFDALFEVNPELLGYDQDAILGEADSAATSAAVAKASLDAADAAETIARNQYDQLSEQLETDNQALEDLVAQNAEAIAQEESQGNPPTPGIDYDPGDIGSAVDGLRAGEAAQRAVEFALGEAGKPYEWGAEGPDSYDCSGLVQTAYSNFDISLPRVANDQFRTTSESAVDVEKMLPGDLIFYGDVPGDWTSVYHVAMYIGDGKMVQAPRPGDVVKVTPVSFSDFFGAHRMVDAETVDDDKDDDKPETSGTDESDTPLAPLPDDPASQNPDTTGPDPTPQPTPTPTPTG